MSRKVIVTGSSGIAAGVIAALCKQSEKIFIIGGESVDSQELQRNYPQILGFLDIDLRDESATESAFQTAIEKLGGLTDVISVVGGSGRKFGDGPLHEMSKQAWNETLDLNLSTAFLTAREGIKALLKNGGGSIILTSSVLATNPAPLYFKTHAYAAAKAAINGLVATLSAAYLKANIRVNAVAPSVAATPMAKRAASDQTIIEYVANKQPLIGEQLPVSTIVPAYLFLFNDSAVTGQIIKVDGGWSSNND